MPKIFDATKCNKNATFCVGINSKYEMNLKLSQCKSLVTSWMFLMIDTEFPTKHLIRYKEKCKQKQKCQNNFISGSDVKIRYFLSKFSHWSVRCVYEDGSNSCTPSIWLPLCKKKGKNHMCNAKKRKVANRRIK